MFGKNSKIAKLTSHSLTSAQTMAADFDPVLIGTVQLSWEALQSISSWWKGEISGKRCTKQIIDSSASILGGYAGGAAGCYIGTVIAPGYGTLIGSAIGGIAGSFTASTFSEWLTEYFFDLPKHIAVENAYRFLGLSLSCSNAEINTKYRALARQYHPDKGGKAEDFHTLQISVAIIKQARGQNI
jgi:hypothetical protein